MALDTFYVRQILPDSVESLEVVKTGANIFFYDFITISLCVFLMMHFRGQILFLMNILCFFRKNVYESIFFVMFS